MERLIFEHLKAKWIVTPAAIQIINCLADGSVSKIDLAAHY
jgi:hypothetical protein